MPVLVDPSPASATELTSFLPPTTTVLDSIDSAQAWLSRHKDEYAVVIGPQVPQPDALSFCSVLRASHPALSVVLVRDTVSTQLFSDALQAGARDVIASDSAASVSDAIARAAQFATALRQPAAEHRGRVITIWSPKGGVGKTTVSVNMAVALSADGANSVCLVDLDLAFGDVAITMQLFPTHSIEQTIGAEETLDIELLEGLLTPYAGSVQILAAPPHPDTRELLTPSLIARVVGALTTRFDFVVLDTAPALDEQTLAALDATDELVLVATLDVPTLKNVKIALETLDVLALAPGRRHLLLNRADEAVGISPDRVQSILGLQPAAQIGSSIDVAASTNAGTPIVVKDPTHLAAAAILQIADLVSDGATNTPAPADAAAEAESSSRLGRRLRKRR